jgi:ubiquinone/menaquinone biosynthesis C-methylase UbiE
MQVPSSDPTPIFDLFRGIHATELLVVAVSHLKLFEFLERGPLAAAELQHQLGLADRPFVVLTTALRAMRLISKHDNGFFELSELARHHLTHPAPLNVVDYIGLAAQNPSVLAMAERLRTNQPQGKNLKEAGTAFIYREGTASAMEEEESARRLTISLAGRARNVAPHLAERVSLPNARLLLDVGGGTGIYSYAMLQRNPELRAIVLDRPEVLKVAEEIASEFGVLSRVEFLAGDMFTIQYPKNMDAVLLSNVLHDWDVPECRRLVQAAAKALKPRGQLVIHDVFLNDNMDGPLAVALYSAALFALTEGRAYSSSECRVWLSEAGLTPQPIVPTLIHCGAMVGIKLKI